MRPVTPATPATAGVPERFSSVGQLLAVMDAHGDWPEEDGLTFREHALQCGEALALARPDDPELQAAGLVHDVGYLLDHDADETHPALGARMVGNLLGERVAWLVRHHVAAKRYLVTVDRAYRDVLSTVSARNLALQGDVLSGEERAALEASPDLDAVLALRRADDAAKVPDAQLPHPTPGLDTWRPVLERLARG